jgi:spermidine/putrescine transport system ATP-binding protein
VPEPILRLIGLAKRFGAVTALDDLSLDVAAGEFLTVLGASGSGKTTTLRLVAGFEAPTAGRIVMAGADVTDLPPYRRDVNTVFQQYALFPHLSVRDNVAYGLRMRGVPRGEIADRVAEGLALVRLDGLGDRRPRQLSGGQQQRVALARALVNRPRVLLLDEPLGALDLKLRREMQLELKHLQTRLGITFIYVTHDQEEALTMSDRIVLLRAGRIEQVGAPHEIYRRPRTAYVAAFIGETNLIPATVLAAAGGTVTLGLTAAGVPATAPAGAPVPDAGARVQLALRPEQFDLAGAGPPGGANELRGIVTDVVFAGAVSRVHVRVGDEIDLVVQPHRDGEWPVGRAVTLRWAPEAGVVLRA